MLSADNNTAAYGVTYGIGLHPCGDGVDETSTLFDLGKLSKNEQSLANHAEPEVTPMWGWGRFKLP